MTRRFDLVPVAFFQNRVGTPGPVDREMDQVLAGLAFFELFDHFFNVLRPVLAAYQRGIRRVHDHECP